MAELEPAFRRYAKKKQGKDSARKDPGLPEPAVAEASDETVKGEL
ncbi:hypothetical protein [Brachybacterium tyrofermentans]|uniref:Uncharacterized protein n=1 Tax=Brachybacterium tyrofermentans TaxID=47848 RepID=A0ABW0FHM6_9MICO